MNKKKLILIIIIFLVCIIGLSLFFIIYFNNRSNETAAVNLYKKMIDVIVSENSGLIENSEYISFDTEKLMDPLNGRRLTKKSINEILDYCKRYNEVVYEKKYDELLSEGLGNETKLDGCLITISLFSRTFNKGTINTKIYSGNLGSSMSTYYINYNDESWEYKDSGQKVSS